MKEPKLALFASLDLVQAGLVAAVAWLVPSGSLLIDGPLWGLAAAMALAAPLLVFAGRPGRLYAGVICLLYWLAGLVFVVLVAGSAGYLMGIYGGVGKALGTVAWLVVALVGLLFWLIPAHQLAWIRQQEQAG